MAKPKPIKARIRALPVPDRTQHEIRGLLFGRPESPRQVYDPDLHPAMLIEHFATPLRALEQEGWIERVEDKGGRVAYVSRPVRPPTFSGFAAKIGVRPETLWIWAKEHTEFGEAAARAKAMQEDALIALGAAGAFDSRFVALIMKNLHGWQDRVEQTNRGAVTLVFDAQDKEA